MFSSPQPPPAPSKGGESIDFQSLSPPLEGAGGEEKCGNQIFRYFLFLQKLSKNLLIYS